MLTLLRFEFRLMRKILIIYYPCIICNAADRAHVLDLGFVIGLLTYELLYWANHVKPRRPIRSIINHNVTLIIAVMIAVSLSGALTSVDRLIFARKLPN